MKGIVKTFDVFPTMADITKMRKRYKIKYCKESKFTEISGVFNNYSVNVY